MPIYLVAFVVGYILGDNTINGRPNRLRDFVPWPSGR